MQQNQPRNRYGIQVSRKNQKPFTWWYPSASARDVVWQSLIKNEPETLLRTAGVK